MEAPTGDALRDDSLLSMEKSMTQLLHLTSMGYISTKILYTFQKLARHPWSSPVFHK
jgi:hypothetical protein